MLPVSHVQVVVARGVRDDKLPTLDPRKLGSLNSALVQFVNNAFTTYDSILNALYQRKQQQEQASVGSPFVGSGHTSNGAFGVSAPVLVPFESIMRQQHNADSLPSAIAPIADTSGGGSMA
jgi:hypothetical protein